jgi:hypothetical protein
MIQHRTIRTVRDTCQETHPRLELSPLMRYRQGEIYSCPQQEDVDKANSS